jgi:D-glycero-D-manno-heptose 1,7-bisphosphate phosphatase
VRPAGPRWQAVFLDRDGTLNVKAPAGRYVRTPDELVLIPGAAAAVRRLNAAGLPTVLVTNQRWMASAGPTGPQQYALVERRLTELLAAEGARLDASYHCPHELARCDCRKPAPGMLLAAARDLGFDPAAAVLVGDAESDLLAARAAGATGLLLHPRGTAHPAAAAVCADLAAAVDEHILTTGGRAVSAASASSPGWPRARS